LWKLSEKKENKDKYDIKKLANPHPPTYNGAADPCAFEEYINDMKKLFDAL